MRPGEPPLLPRLVTVINKEPFHRADEPFDAAVLPGTAGIAQLSANAQEAHDMDDATFVLQVIGCGLWEGRMEKKKADYTALVVWQGAIDLVPRNKRVGNIFWLLVRAIVK